ncbi:hypothetical protein QMK33_00250 [Hymenobacter sp. H14-R3]|uniref:hypothetical protein n=1 Tax=Hymenobacter sp. H14-R3 TaxID=3046308 RepID=UPI0024BA5DFC|nr:hypothetical protein [Hymenobacter sp. H14-R3]MDJ0363564.1 hypothetical protein [Hymenobacter sp. H14-R3]
MAEIIVSEGQSLLDVAVWLLGGAEGVWALADANGLAITDALAAGQVLIVPDGATVSADIVAYFQSTSIRVNTTNLHRPAPPVVDEAEDWLETDFKTETDFL